jgi:phosphoribosylanthranilate isomerase
MIPRVKICGITSIEDVELCSRYPVACLGFVTEYPYPVPWNLDRYKVRSLIEQVPPFISTAMVVGSSIDTVLELAEHVRPNTVQLHGNESVEETKELAASLHSLGIKVIKAVRLQPDGTTDLKVNNVFQALKLLGTTRVDGIVLDASSGKGPAGGTGQLIDWTLAKRLRESTTLPIVLAGGLNQLNVAQAVRVVSPYAIDVLSGLEYSPGKKDEARLHALFESLRGVST